MDCTECRYNQNLKRAKDSAVLRIVRAHGIPDAVKMALVNRVLEADYTDRVNAIRAEATEIENAYGVLREIEFNLAISELSGFVNTHRPTRNRNPG